MTRIVFIFGLIASVILSILMFSTFPLLKSGVISYENGALVGYTGMVIAMVTIFFGIKSYRDNHLNGTISFGKAAGVGLLITLIAAVGYSISWEFYFNLFAPDFMRSTPPCALIKQNQAGSRKQN